MPAGHGSGARRAAKLGVDREGWPKCCETEADFDEWLLQRLGPATRLLTRLSEAQNTTASPSQLTPPNQAKALCNKLLNGHQQAAQLMETAADEHWALWAPPHLAGEQSPCTPSLPAQPARTKHFKLHLLVPFEPVVRVAEAASHVDLWRHPLFEPKYKDVLQSACVARQPVDIITTGSTGPTPAWKPIAVFTFGMGVK